jgi:hypothetical protein
MAQIDTLTNVGAVVSTDLALILRGGANVLGTFGSLVGQNSTAVTITGGTINGTVIGGSTPAAGSFTTGAFSGDILQTAAGGRVTFSTTTGNGGIQNNNGSAYSLNFGSSHATEASNVWINSTGGSVKIKNAGGDIGVFSSTGLAVTGAATFSAGVTLGTAVANNTIHINNSTADMYLGISGGAIFGYTSGAISTVFNTSATPLGIGTAGSQPLIFGTASTARMTLDASGNLGVGTSSATSIAGFNKVVKLEDAANASYVVSGGVHEAEFAISSDGGWLGTSTSIPQRFVTNGEERMTLDASGRLGINVNPSTLGSPMLAINQAAADWSVNIRNSNAAPYGAFFKYTATPNNTSFPFIRCDDGTAERFNIASNGNVSNFTGAAIGTISDVRLKENITPATPKLSDILKVEIINYNRIGSDQKLLGVKAHQLQEIFPSLVDSTDTREYDDDGVLLSGFEDQLSVKVGFDFATYTKCFQEQQAIIEALTARIEALEGAN